MSMLAERKRKVKWSLNPARKPLWNTDYSSGMKIGKNLMEKMGWYAGKGLGANEQGISEPLKLHYQTDNKGVGFKENDNEWVQQQEDFNKLLNMLSDNTNREGDNEIQSLEEKSKQSKARVHYQKFTRGKDVSKYSEKDLECILGGKTNKGKVEVDKSDIGDNEEFNTDKNSYLIVNSMSSTDYFATKFKSKKCEKALNNFCSTNDETFVDDNAVWPSESKPKEDCNKTELNSMLNVQKNKSGKKSNKCKTKLTNSESSIPNMHSSFKTQIPDCLQTENLVVDPDESSQAKDNIVEEDCINVKDEEFRTPDSNSITKRKKHKRKEHCNDGLDYEEKENEYLEGDDCLSENAENIKEQKKESKLSFKRNATNSVNDFIENENKTNESGEVLHSSKYPDLNIVSNSEVGVIEKKRRKKEKRKQEVHNNPTSDVNEENENRIHKHKKHKKDRVMADDISPDIEFKENPVPKKKKKGERKENGSVEFENNIKKKKKAKEKQELERIEKVEKKKPTEFQNEPTNTEKYRVEHEKTRKKKKRKNDQKDYPENTYHSEIEETLEKRKISKKDNSPSFHRDKSLSADNNHSQEINGEEREHGLHDSEMGVLIEEKTRKVKKKKEKSRRNSDVVLDEPENSVTDKKLCELADTEVCVDEPEVLKKEKKKKKKYVSDNSGRDNPNSGMGETLNSGKSDDLRESEDIVPTIDDINCPKPKKRKRKDFDSEDNSPSEESIRKREDSPVENVAGTAHTKKAKSKNLAEADASDDCSVNVIENSNDEKEKENSNLPIIYKTELLKSINSSIASKIVERKEDIFMFPTILEKFRGSSLKSVKGYGMVKFVR